MMRLINPTKMVVKSKILKGSVKGSAIYSDSKNKDK